MGSLRGADELTVRDPERIGTVEVDGEAVTYSEVIARREELNAKIAAVDAAILRGREDLAQALRAVRDQHERAERMAREERERLSAKRRHLGRLLRDPRTGQKRNSADAWRVRTSDVAAHLREYRAVPGNSWRKLVLASGVSVRTLGSMLNPDDVRHYPYVTFDTADRVLTALGKGDEIHNLTLVQGNGRTRLARRRGSTRTDRNGN